MPSAFIRGVNLAFDRAGDGDDLVLFLHGVGADRSGWREQVAFFAQQEFTAVALDCRGHGDSEAGADISLGEFAQDAADLVRALGFDSAHWVGLSMGGVIALQAWRTRPETIASLTLANSFAYFPDGPALLDRLDAALQTTTLPDLARQRIPLTFGRPPAPAILEAAVAAMARKDPDAYRKSWAATWTPDFRPDLPGISVPTLVLGGTADRITPPALSEALAAGIPGARLVLLEGAGHQSNLDAPVVFNQAVLTFLCGLPPEWR